MSVNSKHSAGRNEKLAKRAKRKKLEDSEDLESSEEELDLTKECHPIGYYINDRAEMINQMFSVIKGNKLKAMLPPVLKDCDVELLKLKCLDQLLGMSEKRISRILDGEVLESSSESDVDSNECDSDEKKTSSSTTSNRSDESSDEECQTEKKSKRKGKRKHNLSGDEKQGKVPQNESNPPEQGKTLLEILELEMRARAIRALLKQNEINQEGNGSDAKIGDSKENGVKEVSHEVVDLTGCEDDELLDTRVNVTNPEESVDRKISTFEEKIDKSRMEKSNQDEEKARRTQNQLEMQNKLFKKVYRLKQRRLRNEQQEEAKLPSEGPEEGELTSSEEGIQINIERVSDMRPKVKMTYGEEFETFGSESNTDTEAKTRSNEGDVENVEANTSKDCNNSEPVVDDAACDIPETKSDTIDKSQLDKPDTKSDKSINLQLENDVPKVKNQDTSGPPAEESDVLSTADQTSWRERWLQKDGVQKLVKSSKIYAKVKKRIAEKTQRSKEEVNVTSEAKSEPNTTGKLEVIEGSIKEYEKLVGKAIQPSDTLSKETHVLKDV